MDSNTPIADQPVDSIAQPSQEVTPEVDMPTEPVSQEPVAAQADGPNPPLVSADGTSVDQGDPSSW